MLRRHPALSAVAILTIGLGIGASTLVYSVFHAALLAPLPYASAERLMVVRLSLPDYKDLRESTSLFEDSGVFASNLFTIGDDQVLAGVVSPGFFRTLGVAPALGRVFDENDGGAPLMVLGHGMWKRRFGGDPQIVGRTVRLSNTVYTITGVMPPNFQFPTRAFEFWSNFETTLAIVPQQAQNRSLRIFQAVGRLRESLPPSQAQAELTALADRLAATYPDTNASVAMTLVSVRERLVGNVRGALAPCARRGRVPAVHRLRQRRQPDADAHDGTDPGARRARRARRRPRPNRTPVADREPADCQPRRRSRPRARALGTPGAARARRRSHSADRRRRARPPGPRRRRRRHPRRGAARRRRAGPAALDQWDRAGLERRRAQRRRHARRRQAALGTRRHADRGRGYRPVRRPAPDSQPRAPAQRRRRLRRQQPAHVQSATRRRRRTGRAGGAGNQDARRDRGAPWHRGGRRRHRSRAAHRAAIDDVRGRRGR